MSTTAPHRLPRRVSPAVPTAPAPRRRRKRQRTAAGRRGKSTLRRRGQRAWAAGSRGARVAFILVVGLALFLAINWLVQVVRKPSELFFPVSGALFKTPSQTWTTYAPLFREHATATITPTFLAALAQQEGAGNPVARTYWRWAWDYRPFEIYRPASSSVGMYQMTDGNFAEARQYCIHDHAVARVGAWSDWRSCWFNRGYIRVLPGNAIELTSAYLDATTTAILARHGAGSAPLHQRQHVAATIHLCGAGAGERYVRHGFRFAVAERCGAHDPRAYLAAVDRYERTFASLAQE